MTGVSSVRVTSKAQAPGVLEAYCLSCLYDDFSPGDGADGIPRQRGYELYNALSPYYLGVGGHPIQTWNNDSQPRGRRHHVRRTRSARGRARSAGRKMNLNGGRALRADRRGSAHQPGGAHGHRLDCRQRLLAASSRVGTTDSHDEADYDNFLPSLDFSSKLLENVVVRASCEQDHRACGLRSAVRCDAAGTPPRADALGVIATGGQGQYRPGAAGVDEPRLLARGVLRRSQLHLPRLLRQGRGELHRDGRRSRRTRCSACAIRARVLPALARGRRRRSLQPFRVRSRNDVNMFVFTAMIDNPRSVPGSAADIPRQLDRRRR